MNQPALPFEPLTTGGQFGVGNLVLAEGTGHLLVSDSYRFLHHYKVRLQARVKEWTQSVMSKTVLEVQSLV